VRVAINGKTVAGILCAGPLMDRQWPDGWPIASENWLAWWVGGVFGRSGK
jgi:hypothetical protein